MPEALKNVFFQRGFFDDLAATLQSVYPAFDRQALFARTFDDQWDHRELKDRVRHVAVTLHDLLPPDYRTALGMLRQIAPALAHYGFEQMSLNDFVGLYGLGDWEASIPALEQFTQQMSAEYAVRPFIIHDQDRMMAQMFQWAHHASVQVRRLSTEGCRPRLPWAMALPALKADPSPILPILELLKSDESEDVRRSVANNLNDISKDNPQVVIDVLRRWQEINTDAIKQITHHALRTLIKAGHPDALELLGHDSQVEVVVRNLTVEPETVAVGGKLAFSFEIESTGPAEQNLVIDYLVYFMKANGKQAPKVFKLTKKKLAPGETVQINKRHSFAPITTRVYYPGEHAIAIQVNGTAFERRTFSLTV